MRQFLRPGIAVVLAVLLAACSPLDLLGSADASPALADAPIRTDRVVYHVRTIEHAHELTMELVYTNPTGGTVFIPTCHAPYPPVLQKWVDGGWVTAYAPVVLRCLAPPVEIQAGERYAYTYRVVASRRPRTHPRFEVAEIPGTYRLVWHMLSTWRPDGPEPGLGAELPLEHRISNTFRIE